jgi:transcriptional regulator with XRE-family HTH domain
MRFSERLRELREQAGLTQTQLAERSGSPLGSIRNYEQGQREPYWNVVFKLARALGVSVEAFADCVEANDQPTPTPRGRPRKPRAAAGKARGKKKGP